MAVEVILPKVDMDMATGTIAKWHVKDGDEVKKGQALFDIETDKSAMEIESPSDGTIRISHSDPNVAIAIGSVVAMIYATGEAVANPVSSVPAHPVIPAKLGAAPLPPERPGPSLRRMEEQEGKVRATPLARRLAKQRGIDLAALSGTGPRGRITSTDLAKVQVSTPPPVQPAPDSAAIRALYQPGSYVVTPLDGMRRTIAQRLQQSKQTVPHFYLSTTCNMDALLATRQRLNASAPRRAGIDATWKLSINDFVIKAFALALQRVPAANVTYTDEGILQHHASDVSVAVAVEGGLFTPIVRAAESKSLSVISAEMKELAAKARARKLQPQEYQGGTAAISNLGMFGVESFTAIINPPQASILAVGAAVERYVPVNRQPSLVTQMSVTLSVDHRAVDGAVGAALLAAFKALVEDPALMLI